MARNICVTIEIPEMEKARELLAKHEKLTLEMVKNLEELEELRLQVSANLKEPPKDGSRD